MVLEPKGKRESGHTNEMQPREREKKTGEGRRNGKSTVRRRQCNAEQDTEEERKYREHIR